jgi:hypothetical protein
VDTSVLPEPTSILPEPTSVLLKATFVLPRPTSVLPEKGYPYYRSMYIKRLSGTISVYKYQFFNISISEQVKKY